MCVDALLAEGDADFDWGLNLKEFESCVKVDFDPATKSEYSKHLNRCDFARL